MKTVLCLVLLSVAGTAPLPCMGVARADEPAACRPAARFVTAPWWTRRLAETRGRILKDKGACYDLVLVGDSITHRWENRENGAAVYPALLEKYKVLNLGSGGDGTQNVIWRFENNGELDDYTAKVFAVMIGVNNGASDPEGLVRGVEKIVGMIRAKHPESKIVLQAILPHGKNPRAHVHWTKVNPMLRAYAEKNGFTVVKHYIDRAVSAKTDNRPQFQQMIKDSERGIFDVIIVWKLDRFARNRYDSARYKTQLKRNGVKLVSATEVISAGPEGIILESVLEGYAEYYSADLSEKVVRGMTENALKGIYNGGTIPFGYMIDETRHYQPDPLLAPYVEQTFQKYADGATMTDLRDWLKAHNIKNSMGGEMSYNTIQRMLSNRRYIGELRLRDVVQPNAIPALVSEDLFNKVQEKLAKNKKAPARHKAEESYLLTTKLYCGKCGALMFGESGVSHTGKMYTYYKCAAAKKKKTCDKKAVRKQWLEDLVVNETMKLVEDDASMNAIIAKVMELQNQESTDLPIYEKQLKETEVGITNMLNAIQMGILTSSTKERLEALEEQRKELQARIAEERLAKPKMKEEFVRFWLLRFRKLDMTQPEQRQALVDTFINAIYLYDDKVLITFNYKEGTETIAFGEAVKAEKSSDMSARGAPTKER